MLLLKPKERGSVTKIANRLGAPGSGPHEWLVLTPKDKMPQPIVVSFPKPPKAPDGSLLYERVPNKTPDVVAVPVAADKELTIIPAQATSTIRKRAHEEQQLNGTEGKSKVISFCHPLIILRFGTYSDYCAQWTACQTP